MKKVVSTRQLPKSNQPFQLETLEFGRAPTQQEILKVARDAWGLVTTLEDKMNQQLLEQLPNLKAIAQFAVGTNNIDLDFCRAHKIIVTNTPDVLTEATAELTFALMLNCARQIHRAAPDVSKGKWIGWEPMGHLGIALKNKKLGIIGAGRIGQRIAEMARGAFDMQILYHNRKANLHFEKKNQAKLIGFEQLLTESDVVVLMTPLTPETRSLINQKQLLMMKKDAILINTSRGEIINQADLIEVLKADHLFAVGLDVTTPEPLPLNSPLNSVERVLITPHIGSATREARAQMAQLCFDNLKLISENKAPLTSV